MPIQWTPSELKAFREKLHLTQDYVADICGVSPVTISHLETYKVRNPMAIQMYGILLERICAYQQGYLPAFRKTGTNEFMESDIYDS